MIMRFSPDSSSLYRYKCSRRSFLKLGVFAAGATLLPFPTFASTRDSVSPERSLSFYNVNTGESLNTFYWHEGSYISGALAEFNYMLRDFRTDEIKPIDIRLLDFLHDIRMKLESPDPFYIVSGYRSHATNALLRKSRNGVAKNSLHIHGKAADIYMPTVKLSSLRQAAMDLRTGGVGYYPGNSFIHLDVGPVRYW